MTGETRILARSVAANDPNVIEQARCYVFGPLILHEITAHRIEQFKREHLAGK